MVSRWWPPLRPLALLVVVALLGALFGLGGAASLGGVLATFVLGAAFGGSLHSDLRVLAWFGAGTVLGVGAITLLDAHVPAAADLLVVVTVLVAGLMPVLGSRFVGVGVGLGMTAVYARGIGTGSQFTVLQAFGAPALAVAVVVVLRWAQGRSDPSGPVRVGLADALVDLSPLVVENAARLVETDRPRRWLDQAARGLHAYRNAVVLLTGRGRPLGPRGEEVDQELRTAAGVARRLADALRPAVLPDPPPASVRRPDLGPSPSVGAELVGELWWGLDLVRTATVRRDPTIVDAVALPVRHSALDLLRATLTWRSVPLRHAVRSALAMAVALAVLHLFGLPFATTFLVATYSTVQPTRSDSVRRARDRVAGTLVGATALGVAVGLLDLPHGVLAGLVVVALVVTYYFRHSLPVVGNAGLIFTTVGVTSSTQQLDPASATQQCIAVSLLGVGIGLLFGFAAVPGTHRPGTGERWSDAVRALGDLLNGVSAALRSGTVDRTALGRRFRAVAVARTNLVTHQPGTDLSDEQRDAAERGAETVREMATAALALVAGAGSGPSPDLCVDEIGRLLVADTDPDPVRVVALLPPGVDDRARRLVDALVSGVVSLRRAARDRGPA